MNPINPFAPPEELKLVEEEALEVIKQTLENTKLEWVVSNIEFAKLESIKKGSLVDQYSITKRLLKL